MSNGDKHPTEDVVLTSNSPPLFELNPGFPEDLDVALDRSDKSNLRTLLTAMGNQPM